MPSPAGHRSLTAYVPNDKFANIQRHLTFDRDKISINVWINELIDRELKRRKIGPKPAA